MAIADPHVINIDREGVVRIGQRIDVAQREFGRLAGELQAQLGNMHRDWQGEGGAAFSRLMAEWQERQGRITKLLQAFEDSLTQTQKASADQDAAQASSLSALGNRLGQ